MQMFQDEAGVKAVIEFCKSVCLAMSDYYIDAGCDVIALVDPMTSQIGPKHFRQFITEPVSEVFEHIRKQDRLSSFFVCGHAQQNIEAMCECRPDNVSVDENIPLDYFRDICLANSISFGGNIQLTVVLLLGSRNDVQINAQDCLNTGGQKGFVLAPGCDLPYATSPENLEAVADTIILNKTDSAPEERVSETSERLTELNPHAVQLRSSYCDIPAAELEAALSPPSDRETRHPGHGLLSMGRPVSIHSAVLRSTRKITAANLDRFLAAWQEKAYRIKGYVNLDDRSVVRVQVCFDDNQITAVDKEPGPTELIALGPGVYPDEFVDRFRSLTVS